MKNKIIFISTVIVTLFSFKSAFAYVGPGIGITFLGSLGVFLGAAAISCGSVLYWVVLKTKKILNKTPDNQPECKKETNASDDEN